MGPPNVALMKIVQLIFLWMIVLDFLVVNEDSITVDLSVVVKTCNSYCISYESSCHGTGDPQVHQ